MDDEKTIDQDVQRVISGEETPEEILARIRARRRAEAQEAAGEESPQPPSPPVAAPSEKAPPAPAVPPGRPPAGTGQPGHPPVRTAMPSTPPAGRPDGAPAPADYRQAPLDRNAAAYRNYMHSARRPSVYTDSAADDAYEAAYRDAMRKAAGEKTPGGASLRSRFAVGVIVLLFAVFGFGCAVFFGVKGIGALARNREQALCGKYNALLVPVAAVDPDSFDDLSDASMADLIKVTLWSIVGSGVEPDRYRYENGELCVPAADVEAAYAACFGDQRPIAHASADGYGYTFHYSEEDNAYFIPMTTLEPLYTPRVTSVETKSGATVVTCGLISSGLWMQDAQTGDIAAPEPDRYVRVTFRTASGAEYISAVQSLGMPETALPSGGGLSSSAVPAAPDAAETTTGQNIVITWD